MSKEEFKDKLMYGDEEWEHLPYNFQDGQPCEYGCIMKKRLKPPYDYHLVGDCRNPSAVRCRMNVEESDKRERKRIREVCRARANEKEKARRKAKEQ